MVITNCPSTESCLQHGWCGGTMHEVFWQNATLQTTRNWSTKVIEHACNCNLDRKCICSYQRSKHKSLSKCSLHNSTENINQSWPKHQNNVCVMGLHCCVAAKPNISSTSLCISINMWGLQVVSVLHHEFHDVLSSLPCSRRKHMYMGQPTLSQR